MTFHLNAEQISEFQKNGILIIKGSLVLQHEAERLACYTPIAPLTEPGDLIVMDFFAPALIAVKSQQAIALVDADAPVQFPGTHRDEDRLEGLLRGGRRFPHATSGALR